MLEKYEKILNEYSANKQEKVNQFQIKTIHWNLSVENAEKFNTIYRQLCDGQLNTIIRTESGGIARTNNATIINNSFAYDVVTTSSSCRLTLIIGNKAVAFTIGTDLKDEYEFEEDTMTPIKAWRIFVKKLEEDGIDLNDYKLLPELGEITRRDIQPPPIEMFVLNETLENAHHIDYNSSFPAGLANTHPEFRKTIEKLYEQRRLIKIKEKIGEFVSNKEKEHSKQLKAILNYCISGCMQSSKTPWRAQWAHLCKDARENNNRRIKLLSKKIENSGCRIIGYNTDGIWYQGPIYHDENEGNKLGQWSNDHTNCIFRAKSKGAYEFIENGKYNVVLRGLCKYDLVKDRENWQWGDIYRTDTTIFKFKFIEGTGLVVTEESQDD